MKKRRLRGIQYFRIGSALICLMLFLTALCLSRQLSGKLYSQNAAERWQGTGDLSFAQISAFVRPDTQFTIHELESIHESVNEKLTAASLKAQEHARLWYDAYSIEAGTAEITGKRKNPAQAAVTAVGGDFFRLHAMKFVNGSSFADNDLMHDRVVIDTLLAWQLFGSSNVTGMEISIDGKNCLIAGVIRPETDYASEIAYGEKPRIYISYDFYQNHFPNADSGNISCYEIVLPNPVRGFARKILMECLGSENEFLFMQNTGRYTLPGRWETLQGLRKLLISENISCPYWENAARIVSFDTAVLLLAEICFLIWPVIYFIFLLWKIWRLAEEAIADRKRSRKKRYSEMLY